MKFPIQKYIFCIVVGIIAFSYPIHAQSGWDSVSVILNRIIPPTFPNKEFTITSFGAVSNGTTDCSAAIKKAIDSCSILGGGKVIIPAGTFLTGAVYLKSNVNLYIAKGATLLFTTDKTKYLPVVYTRFEGTECMNYSPFIYANGETNIALTGSGTIDGQGNSTSNWWDWKNASGATTDVNNLLAMGASGTPVAQRIFGSGHYLRPNFVQFYNCKNILIDSITILRSPMWEIHPVLSQNITVSNIIVDTHGPNNDGCDPESCTDVLIKNCSFNTGDDCIAIKSGKNEDGRRVNVPSQNIVVKNCKFQDGHGGVTMGSEMSGGIKNVYADSCSMNSTNFYCMLRLKTNTARGGTIENIYMKNTTATTVTTGAIHIDMMYNSETGTATPSIKNIFVENISCTSGPYAVYINDLKASPVTNLQLKNSTFTNITNANRYGYAQGIVMSNVKINGSIITENKESNTTGKKAYAILQNYPNPFNPSTSLKVVLPESGTISLKVFDMLGNEVKTIVSEYKTAGEYKYEWDGTSKSGFKAPSGTYVCRISTSGYTQSIKIALLK